MMFERLIDTLDEGKPYAASMARAANIVSSYGTHHSRESIKEGRMIYRKRREAVAQSTRAERALATLALHEFAGDGNRSPHRAGPRMSCRACRPAQVDLEREFRRSGIEFAEAYALHDDLLLHVTATAVKPPFWVRDRTPEVSVEYHVAHIERMEEQMEVIEIPGLDLMGVDVVPSNITYPTWSDDFA